MNLKAAIEELRSIGGWKEGMPPTFREQMIERYGSWEEYELQSESEPCDDSPTPS